MPVWLVTGGSGFLGRHVLARARGRSGVDVLALGRRLPGRVGRRSGSSTADLEHPASAGAGDRRGHARRRDPPGRPDAAGRARARSIAANTLATRPPARRPARRRAGRSASCSPARRPSWGRSIGRGLPVGEDHPCRPADAYGLSKWLATCAGLAARPPLEVVVARVFNPIGPGQPRTQAFGRFAGRAGGRLADDRWSSATSTPDATSSTSATSPAP